MSRVRLSAFCAKVRHGFAVLATTGLLVGCAAGTPEAVPETTGAPLPTERAASPSPVASPSPTADAGEGVGEVVEASPTAAPTTGPASTVVLHAHGVGDVWKGTVDPEEQLVALLGEPDERLGKEDWTTCGSGFVSSLAWADLTVFMDDGMLSGWSVTGPDVPDGVALPYGIAVDDPVGKAQAVYLAKTDDLVPLSIFLTHKNGLEWWHETDDPAAPITLVGSEAVICD